MLKLAGETDIGREKIETITYSPGLQDTADLEAATKTITATSEASGVGNADYSAALTLTAPSDARLVVNSIVARLAVNIDSFDTATILYCRVYVDAQDANHRLFDESWNSTGDKRVATDCRVTVKETIFDLLRDGSSHTFYFFFWIDQANNAVISYVRLHEGVGNQLPIASGARLSLTLSHKGLASIAAYVDKEGTGTPTIYLLYTGTGGGYRAYNRFAESSGGQLLASLLVVSDPNFYMGGTVITDLNYLVEIVVILRSEL